MDQSAAAAAPNQITPCQLYRHYGADGQLLYVGVSQRIAVRHLAHKMGAHWYLHIASIKIEVFPDRRSALIAEAKAIASENPLHNRLAGAVILAGIKDGPARTTRPKRPRSKTEPPAGSIRLLRRHVDSLLATGYRPREMAWRILDEWIANGSSIIGELAPNQEHSTDIVTGGI